MARNEIVNTAQNAMVTINTANSNLDGTGTLGTVITGTGSGINIKRIFIKAIGDVTQGMVRLFIDTGSGVRLIREIPIPTVDQRGVTPAFQYVIQFPKGLVINNGWILKASTQNAESFNILAEGVSWNYPGDNVIEFTAADQTTTVSTANSNLDGTGTLATLITGVDYGTDIKSITIKAVGSSTIGMVRLFLYDGTNTKLFMEVPIPTSAQYAVVPAISRVVNFGNSGFLLKTNWSIKVSTEVAQSFAIIADAVSWDYSFLS